MVKKKIDIKGRKVIDVGFRLTLLEEAERRKISNLDMKNIRNSDKEKEKLEVFLGDDEEKVNKFIEWIKTPSNKPEEAEIDEDGIREYVYSGDIITREEYYKTFNASQLTKIATSGIKLLKTQNEILETQNKMLDIQFKMLERQDKISDSITETVELQADMNSRISRFSKFGQQIVSTQDEIKDKIDKIGRDIKTYVNKRIGDIDQKIVDMNEDIKDMKLVKRR